MTGIIIQARMNSARLPGKMLKKLAGKELLWHVVKRCRESKTADKIIVATSIDKHDDKLYDFCKKNKIEVVRGSLDNVLSRFYQAAAKYKLDTIVRITGDCPLIAPDIIDKCLKLYFKNNKKINYVANSLDRIFPRGLDVEVFSFKALGRACKKAKTKIEKEHVTPYIIEHEKTLGYKVQKKYQSDLRLTVDTRNDYKLLSHIYDKFYKPGKIINTAEVIEYLNNRPGIAGINKSEGQKNIKAIVVLGGALKKDDKTGMWRTTKYEEAGDKFGAHGDRMRAVAGALEYLNNPTNAMIVVSGGKGQLKKTPGAEALATVLARELIELKVPKEKIIKEARSGTSYAQLIELKKIIKRMEFEQVVIISNKWHLPRIKAMIDYAPGLKDIHKIAEIKLASAEKIALKFEKKKWEKIIKKAYNSDSIKKRIRLEKKGTKQIKNGTYKFLLRY